MFVAQSAVTAPALLHPAPTRQRRAVFNRTFVNLRVRLAQIENVGALLADAPCDLASRKESSAVLLHLCLLPLSKLLLAHVAVLPPPFHLPGSRPTPHSRALLELKGVLVTQLTVGTLRARQLPACMQDSPILLALLELEIPPLPLCPRCALVLGHQVKNLMFGGCSNGFRLVAHTLL